MSTAFPQKEAFSDKKFKLQHSRCYQRTAPYISLSFQNRQSLGYLRDTVCQRAR